MIACKPVVNPRTLQDLVPRQNTLPRTDICAATGSKAISDLTILGSKAVAEVAQVKLENFIVINLDDDDKDKAQKEDAIGADVARKNEEVIQQVNRGLLMVQKDNAAEIELDNVLRAVALAQEEPDKSIVVLVVTEIVISVKLDLQAEKDKKENGETVTSVFKQGVVVANRGKQVTETVMGKHASRFYNDSKSYKSAVYDPRTLTVADDPKVTGAAKITDASEALATKTVEAVIFNAKPTHSAVIPDPAARMRAALEATLEDRQRDENRINDVQLNVKIAIEVKVIGPVEDNKDAAELGRDDAKDNDEDDKEKQRKEDEERERLLQQKQEQEKKDQDQKKKEAEQKQRELDEKKADQQQEQKAEQEEREKKEKEAEQKAKDAEQKKKDAEQKQAEQQQREQERKEAEQKQREQEKKDDEKLAKASQEAEEKARAEAEAERKADEEEAERKAKENIYA